MMTVDSKSYVLLVDDDESFAKQYAFILQKRCGVIVLPASTAEDALRLTRENPIKVVILDQVMPTKGTELLPKIRNIAPKIKSILLTAQADRRDMADATEIGFNVTLLKEDADMERLPMKVLLLIAQYNNERYFEHMENASPVFVQENSDSPFHIFGKKYRVEYTIVGYEPLEKDYVTEDSWKSYRRIQKGQTIAQSEDINMEQEFGFSSDFKLQNEDELSIGIDNLASFKASLALKIEHDLDVKYSEKRQQTVTRKLELKLLDDASGIVSRDYEYAQVFRKV